MIEGSKQKQSDLTLSYEEAKTTIKAAYRKCRGMTHTQTMIEMTAITN
jgi:hypothetical protein